MGGYAQLAGLEFHIEKLELERRELEVSSEFKRVTTTISLHGDGSAGRGEDVTYDPHAHDDFPRPALAGRHTFAGLSSLLQPLDLPDYRRWAFESAALDLALRQNGLSLGAALGRPYAPVRFVVSTRSEIGAWRELYPELEFKLDPTPEWDEHYIRDLAAADRVRVLDLKGQYHGTPVDNPPDPALYRAVVTAFPAAVLEDPAWNDETKEALRGAEERLSWDAPIHSLAEIAELPLPPRFLNIKPSRFGRVETLLETIEHCQQAGMTLYGGGQFELGVGRRHIQVLASLFYPDAANDVAPSVYNEGGARPGLPESPLPAPEALGL